MNEKTTRQGFQQHRGARRAKLSDCPRMQSTARSPARAGLSRTRKAARRRRWWFRMADALTCQRANCASLAMIRKNAKAS